MCVVSFGKCVSDFWASQMYQSLAKVACRLIMFGCIAVQLGANAGSWHRDESDLATGLPRLAPIKPSAGGN